MNQLISLLEETADAIALNPQHYLSRRRMLRIASVLERIGLKSDAAMVRQASREGTENMIDLLRLIANSI